jgi:hypothetical protein
MKIKAIGHLVKTNPIQSQFKAKQSQFAGCPNERKFNINKGL